jgi:hypothetical protein
MARDWTVFVFVGSYPFKRGQTPPEHLIVFVDDSYTKARERYHEEKGAYPEAHGMMNFEGSSKQKAWDVACRSGFVGTYEPRDHDAEHVGQKKQTLVIAFKQSKPAVDGLFCQGPCNTYCTYVEPNQPDGGYICPDCRP